MTMTSDAYRLQILKNALVNEPQDDVRRSAVIPFVHNKGFVILQFFGWAIILNSDGTWAHDQDTSGG